MTQDQMVSYEHRLVKLENGTAPPKYQLQFPETAVYLRQWWAKKLREEKNKVVSIDDFRKRRWSF